MVETTYRLREAVSSRLVWITTALYLVKSPEAVSNAASAPKAVALVPTISSEVTKETCIQANTGIDDSLGNASTRAQPGTRREGIKHNSAPIN
jgi:hypothetical protein